MTETHDQLRSDRARGTRFVIVLLATATVAVISVGSTYALWFGHVDICNDRIDRWFAVALISPLILVGFLGWLVALAPTDSKRVAWLLVLGVLVMVYVPAVILTAVGVSMAASSC